MDIWFILRENHVEGPFNTQYIKTEVLDHDVLIWGNPLNGQWLDKTDWLQFLSSQSRASFSPVQKKNLSATESSTNKKVHTVKEPLQEQEPTQIQSRNQTQTQFQAQDIQATKIQEVAKWFYRTKESTEEVGPFDQEQIAMQLRNLDSLQGVLLWNPTLSGWKKPSHFPELFVNENTQFQIQLFEKEIEEIVVVERVLEEETHSLICQAHKISQTGILISNCPDDMKVGEEVDLKLSFAQLQKGITVRSKVKRIVGNRKAELSFSAMQGESKSVLISYLKEQTSVSSKKAA